MVKVSPLQAKMGPLSHSLSILSTESGGKGKGKTVWVWVLGDTKKAPAFLRGLCGLGYRAARPIPPLSVQCNPR